LSSADIRTHSALHVLKGAAEKVLGTKWTASVYVSGVHGRLTLRAEERPTKEELARIEQEANRKIKDAAEILEFEMEREEAERHFGEAIYDLFPIPKEVTRLRIVRVPDWNINCCTEGHVENTLQIGGIKLEGVRFRSNKQLLEIGFRVKENNR